MFLGNIFKKYKEREYRIMLVKDLIEELNINEVQKKLYNDSLELLDNETLEIFFNKLTSLIEIIEDDNNNKIFQQQKQDVYKMNNDEYIQRTKEINSFNLILDNI